MIWLALAAEIVTTSLSGVTTITYHPGGAGVEALRLMRAPALIVDGVCNSACAWGAWSNPNMCYTTKASFYFHTPQDPGTNAPLEVATKWWLSKQPSWVQPELKVSAKTLARLEPDRQCLPSKKLKKQQKLTSTLSSGWSTLTESLAKYIRS